MRKIALLLLFLLICVRLEGRQPAQAQAVTPLHTRYFESLDVRLTDDRFQMASYAGLQGERITLVIYGLDAGAVPGVMLFDPNGAVLAEDTNPEADSIAFVQVELPANGMYTALLSRQTEVGGLFRIMLMEGAPLNDNLARVDTIDPFLPPRAFLLAREQSVTIRLPAQSGGAALFASRGSDVIVPPLEERTSPVQVISWTNGDDRFYTMNVRATPDPLASRVDAFLSYGYQDTPATEVFTLEVGDGGEAKPVPRDVCGVFLNAETPLYSRPDSGGQTGGSLPAGEAVEIVGENGDWLQIVDANSPTGYRWIARSSIESLNPAQCGRVGAVDSYREEAIPVSDDVLDAFSEGETFDPGQWYEVAEDYTDTPQEEDWSDYEGLLEDESYFEVCFTDETGADICTYEPTYNYGEWATCEYDADGNPITCEADYTEYDQRGDVECYQDEFGTYCLDSNPRADGYYEDGCWYDEDGGLIACEDREETPPSDEDTRDPGANDDTTDEQGGREDDALYYRDGCWYDSEGNLAYCDAREDDNTDSGASDSGRGDTTTDPGTTDSGRGDTTTTGTTDPGPRDTTTDAGTTDSGGGGTTDAGATDSGRGGTTDTGTTDGGRSDGLPVEDPRQETCYYDADGNLMYCE